MTAAISLLASGLGASSAWAQSTAPPPAPSLQVPQQDLPTREELEHGGPPPPAAPSHLHVEGEVESAPCALDAPAYAAIKIRLSKADFANLGPVPASFLEDSYREYLGTEQPIGVICRIRDRAATALRALGYVAAVEVPVQHIVGGEVRFEVLYARVTAVHVVGQVGRSDRLFQAYLQKLVDGQVFNRFKAERIVLLARNVPGYDVRLALKPAGTGAGNMIAEVSLVETPVEADFNASDLGAASTGRFGGQFRVSFNGLTGMGDRTTISAYSSADFRRQQIYQFGHSLLLGGNGLSLAGNLTYALTRPDLGAGTPPIDAKTLLANVEVGYPLIHTPGASLRAAAGMDIVDQVVRLDGAPLSRDHLRVLYLRLDMTALDMRGTGPDGSVGWRLGGSLELRHGVDILGASPNCVASPVICGASGFVPAGIPNGDPEATVVRASANLEVHPLRPFTFFVAPRAQIASAPVLGFEQFSLGNYTVGRGYDPGAVAGDSGIAVTAELRLTPLKFSPTSRFSFEPYVFSDSGRVWHKQSASDEPERTESVGGGVRVGFANRSRLDLFAAVPLNTLPGENKLRDVRILASLAINILPWGAR